MISGVLYALLAGLMWGLIFVGPLIVPEYPAMLQSMGRYLALGLIALPIAWLGRVRLRQLARRDWLTALMLTMMGNLIYYFCLASAIQRTGAPVSTMIIGTLPVVIPVFANLLYSQRDGKLAWGKLAPALICIGIGLASVNIAELNHGLPLQFFSSHRKSRHNEITMRETCSISSRQATAARCTSKEDKRRIEVRNAVFTSLRLATKLKNTNCIAKKASADGIRAENSVTPPKTDEMTAIVQ